MVLYYNIVDLTESEDDSVHEEYIRKIEPTINRINELIDKGNLIFGVLPEKNPKYLMKRLKITYNINEKNMLMDMIETLVLDALQEKENDSIEYIL